MKLDIRTLGLYAGAALVGATLLKTVMFAVAIFGGIGIPVYVDMGAFIQDNLVLILQVLEIPLVLGLVLLARFLRPSFTGLFLVALGVLYNLYELFMTYVDSLKWKYPFGWQILFDIQNIGQGLANPMFGFTIVDLLSFGISVVVAVLGVLLLVGSPAQKSEAADEI